MNVSVLLYIIGGGLILTVGDVFIRYWSATKHLSFYAIGMTLWILGLVFLAQSISYDFRHIVSASMGMILVNLCTLTLVNWFVFHDPFSPYEILGLILGLAAFVLLESSFIK